jgi:hypothetical protein
MFSQLSQDHGSSRKGGSRISHALMAYAGEASETLARHYPFPHNNILAAPSERLHLAAYSAAHGQTDREVFEAILSERSWGKAVPAELLPKLCDYRHVFRKLVTPGYIPHTYRALDQILGDPRIDHAFRMATTISQSDILKMFVLPTELRLPVLFEHLGTVKEAELFRKVFERLTGEYGIKPDSLITQVSRATNDRSIWKILWSEIDEILPDLPPLMIELPDGFTHLRSVREINEASKKYKNCLDVHYPAQMGEEAIVIHHHEPVAILSLGIRYDGTLYIEQLCGPANASLSQENSLKISNKLQEIGIETSSKTPMKFLDDLKDALSSVYRINPEKPYGRESKVASALCFLTEHG